ncbi:tyrosine-type recombinase/integrase [Anaerobacillus sp. HL2]|nr:tyrosine-type recombinase/integrase [Anaerobacillus sp. HL2]
MKAELPNSRFHDLRHTHATILLQKNVHPKVVSERLGHSKISITLDTYSHVLPSLQDGAASIFDDGILNQKITNGTISGTTSDFSYSQDQKQKGLEMIQNP